MPSSKVVAGMAPPSDYSQPNVIALGLAEMLLGGSGFQVAQFMTVTVLLVYEVIIVITINPSAPKGLLTGDVAESATSAATDLPSSLPLFGIGVDEVMTTCGGCFLADRARPIGGSAQ